MEGMKKWLTERNSKRNGLFVHYSTPKLLGAVSPAQVRQWVREGDVTRLERAVFAGHGRRLLSDWPSLPSADRLQALIGKCESMHAAVERGSLRELQELLETEYNHRKFAMCQDEAGVGLLHKAVYYDFMDIAEWLVQKYPKLVHQKDSEGRTPLHYAAVCRSEAAAAALLEGAGAVRGARDAAGHTPAFYRNSRRATLALPTPPDANMPREQANGLVIKRHNIRIWCHDCDMGKLQRVVWAGQGARLLTEVSNQPVVKKFLEAVPYIMNTIRDIHNCVVLNDLEGLMKHATEPVPAVILSSRDQNNMTVMHKAAGLGHVAILKYITDRYPQGINDVDNDGRTPLHYAAAIKDDQHTYHTLVALGADESVVDNKNKTAGYYLNRSQEIDTKLLRTLPDAPRTISSAYPSSWDWKILDTDSIVELNKKSRRRLKVSSNENLTSNSMSESTRDTRYGGMKQSSTNEYIKGLPGLNDIRRSNERLAHQEDDVVQENKDSEQPEDVDENEVTHNETEDLQDNTEEHAETTQHNDEEVEESHDVVETTDGDSQENAIEPEEEKVSDHEDTGVTESQENQNNELADDVVESENKSHHESEDAAATESEQENCTENGNDIQSQVEEPVNNVDDKYEHEHNMDLGHDEKEVQHNDTEDNQEESPDADDNEGNGNSSTNENNDNDIAKNHNDAADNNEATSSPAKEGNFSSGRNTQESLIEGIVEGETEMDSQDASIAKNGQSVNGDVLVVENEIDPEVGDLINSSNMEMLAALVLNGEGARLVDRRSRNPEVQAFLENVPTYMQKIHKVHLAAREGNIRDLQAALDRRKFAIARDPVSPNGATPLHVATIFGKTNIIKYLGGRFPETLSAVDFEGRTSLHYAAVLPDNGHYFNLLQQLGANAKDLDDNGRSAEEYRKNPSLLSFHQLASDFGLTEDAVKNMLSDKSSSNPADDGHVDIPVFKTDEGRYLAKSLGDPLIKGLTEVANVKPKDPVAFLASFLHNFPEREKPRLGTQETQIIVTKGVPELDNNEAPPPPVEVDEEVPIPARPIDVITVEPHTLPPEASPDAPEAAFSSANRDEHGQSMLHFAAARAHTRNALFDLLQETDVSLAYRDELYRTARDVSLQANVPENTVEIDRWLLQLAARGNKEKLMELLLEGYDHILDVVDEEGASIHEVVSQRGIPGINEFLASVSTFEEARETLHSSVRRGDLAAVQQALSGAGGRTLARAKNYFGRSALHVAVLAQHEDVCSYLAQQYPELLRLGDNLERTPLHYAMGVDKIESLSRILIRAGAKRVLKDLKGRQPSYYFMNKSDILRLKEEEEVY